MFHCLLGDDLEVSRRFSKIEKFCDVMCKLRAQIQKSI